MAEVSRVNDPLTTLSTSNSSYCVYTYYVSCNCDEYGCDSCPRYSYSSATVNGKITTGSNNVFVNGIAMAHAGSTVATDARCPSSYEGSSSGDGSVTGGSSTVFVNGKAVAFKGSAYRAHTGDTSTISGGSNNVFVGG